MFPTTAKEFLLKGLQEVAADEESLFKLYWRQRFDAVPTDEQRELFIASNILCVHCRAGAVFRGEPTIRNYEETV